ncbi:MAG TPA: flagellar export protein FliJ [Povalibacter sp.]|nr:flagellar export protein FliJ [Povalibacter sp.]
MNRAKRLQPVQELLEDTERKLARSVVVFEQRVQEAEAKLLELERYRDEYQRQYTERVAQGIGVTGLRDYQAFLVRLGEAIRQQRTIAQRASGERDVERARWQKAAQRSRAVDHVVDQWQLQEQRAADRREQIEIDERGQRVRTER